MMLYRLGIVPAFNISRPNGASGHVIQGKTIKKSGPLYMLIVGGKQVNDLAAMLGEANWQEHINGRVRDRIVDGYVHRYVRGVEIKDYDGPVYNFEVEEDHSYQTESFLVHNCDVHSMAVEEIVLPASPYAFASSSTQASNLPPTYEPEEGEMDEQQRVDMLRRQQNVGKVLQALGRIRR